MPKKRRKPKARSPKKRRPKSAKREEVAEAELGKLDLRDLSKYKLKLNPWTGDFDHGNALFMAVASSCAYHAGDDSDGKMWAEKIFSKSKPRFDSFFPFPENRRDTEGFEMANRDTVVVSFCGTDSLKDWVNNFDVELIRRYGGWAHEGFWEALNIVWVGGADLLARLRKVASKKSLWFCGHSLGGALAILAAYRCLHSGIPVKGVYTFGQPLVGDGSFKRNFKELEPKVFRFVNQGDPVPLVPIRGIRRLPRNQWKRYKVGKKWKVKKTASEPYVDVGRFFWFSKKGKLSMNRKLPKRSKSTIGAMVKGAGKLASGQLKFKRHAMDLYIRHLLKNR